MFTLSQKKELYDRSSLLYAAAIGLSTGMTATMFYSLGTFIPLLQAEFGWSRGGISLGATFLTIAVFLTGTAAGRLTDRYGAAVVGALSLVAYAGGIALMVGVVQNLQQFWLAYFCIAVLGVGSTPIALVRPITTEFVSARGIALGIALTGAGIAGFWVPRVVANVAEALDWRAAYLTLAAIAAIASPIVWYGFRRGESLHYPAHRTSHQSLEGVSHSQARKSGHYWVLSLMSFTMACGIAGVVVHLVPLFMDLGITSTQAAAIASIVGIASVIGRLVIGYLLDMLPTVLVTITVLLLASAGIGLLWLWGANAGYLAAALIGLAAGAEIDLLAYLTVRYFGRRNYGAIYGWQYSVFALGYGISPYLVGLLYDFSGSYDAPLLGSATLILVAAFSCLWLPKNTPSVQRHPNTLNQSG